MEGLETLLSECRDEMRVVVSSKKYPLTIGQQLLIETCGKFNLHNSLEIIKMMSNDWKLSLTLGLGTTMRLHNFLKSNRKTFSRHFTPACIKNGTQSFFNRKIIHFSTPLEKSSSSSSSKVSKVSSVKELARCLLEKSSLMVAGSSG